jgi:hypothetical protein
MALGVLMRPMAIAAVLAVGAPAYAAAPGFSAAGTISQANARETQFEIVLPGVTSNPMACADASGIFRITNAASNYSTIVSLLITAYAAHKTLQVWNSACDTDGVPLISAVFVTG